MHPSLLLVVLALFLPGCGGDSEPSAQPPTSGRAFEEPESARRLPDGLLEVRYRTFDSHAPRAMGLPVRAGTVLPTVLVRRWLEPRGAMRPPVHPCKRVPVTRPPYTLDRGLDGPIEYDPRTIPEPPRPAVADLAALRASRAAGHSPAGRDARWCSGQIAAEARLGIRSVANDRRR